MRIRSLPSNCQSTATTGFTLAEVLISLALLGMMLGGIINSYLMAAQRAEWASASSAAHRVAVMKLEQLKAAPWEELIGLMGAGWLERSAHLDLPATSDQSTTGTVRFRVDNAGPPENIEDTDLLMFRVECVWNLGSRSYTTPDPHLVTYRGRD